MIFKKNKNENILIIRSEYACANLIIYVFSLVVMTSYKMPLQKYATSIRISSDFSEKL